MKTDKTYRLNFDFVDASSEIDTWGSEIENETMDVVGESPSDAIGKLRQMRMWRGYQLLNIQLLGIA